MKYKYKNKSRKLRPKNKYEQTLRRESMRYKLKIARRQDLSQESD